MQTIRSHHSPVFLSLIAFSLIVFLISGGCDYILPNKPPYVEKIAPADSSVYTIGQAVSFQVNAYDVDGSVVEVVFTTPNSSDFIDDTPPYEFTWQTAGMTEGYYSVQIKAIDNKDEPYIIKAPVRLLGMLTAYAGQDTVYNDSRTSCVLEGEMPPYSQGTWAIISGTGGQISDIHNPNATLTGQSCQTYTLRWTVANGTNQVSAEVTIGFFYKPSKADAGGNQLITDGKTTANLQAVTPIDGTGLWRILSGGTGIFSDASLPNAIFTGQPCGTYNLVWSVSTPCAVTADTVEIRFDQFLVAPDAGPDQSYSDGRKTTVLAGNAPPSGTGMWTLVSGQNGQFSSPNDPKATFNGQLCQTYVLRWTISTPCSSKSDDVTITFNHEPTIALAGADLSASGAIHTVQLNANTPVLGMGAWTVVSGSGGVFTDTQSPASRFTGEPCQTYILQWTISTLCESSSDQVTVTFTDLPSISNAGADQHLTDGTIYVQMNATPPENGTGIWTIVSGGTGSFSNPGDPHAIFTGLLCHSYVLRWTVSTSCSSSFDEVTIVLNQIEIGADAGPDIRISNGSVTMNLQGNSPKVGVTGTWSIISGSGGSIQSPNNPGSLFTGVAGQIYVLKWTFSGACIENSDSVTIAFISAMDLLDPRDGKVYQSVKIGTQVWMSENLNYSTSGSYSYNSESDPASIYGRLYDWTTAQNACPVGWHLPTDLEWRQLEVFLGMDASVSMLEWYRGHNEGEMLKEEGTAYWAGPNSGATNISGFAARPGGYRSPGGIYGGIKIQAGFWSATGNTSGKAIYRALHKDKSQIGRDWYEKGYGFSVRCVKN